MIRQYHGRITISYIFYNADFLSSLMMLNIVEVLMVAVESPICFCSRECLLNCMVTNVVKKDFSISYHNWEN